MIRERTRNNTPPGDHSPLNLFLYFPPFNEVLWRIEVARLLYPDFALALPEYGQGQSLRAVVE